MLFKTAPKTRSPRPFNRFEYWLAGFTDPYRFMRSGKYDKAVRQYSKMIDADPRTWQYYSARGFAYAMLGRPKEAFDDIDRAEELHWEILKTGSDSFGVTKGVILWLMGKEDEAIEMWLRAIKDFEKGKIGYSDAVGGVEAACFLWFGAVRNGSPHEVVSEANAFLQKRTSLQKAKYWPGPLGKYLLGVISEEELTRLAASEKSLRRRRLCQAYFYIAVKALDQGQPEKSVAYLKKATDLGRNSRIQEEYYLAEHELVRSRK